MLVTYKGCPQGHVSVLNAEPQGAVSEYGRHSLSTKTPEKDLSFLHEHITLHVYLYIFIFLPAVLSC